MGVFLFDIKYLNVKKITSISTFLFILLIPFQNTVLYETPLRFLGKSPSFIFLLAIFLVVFLEFGFSRFFVFLLLYIVFVNVMSFFEYHDIFVYGRDLKIKGFSLFFINFIFLIPFLITIKSDFKLVGEWILSSFLLCVLGVFLVDFFSFDFFNSAFFHVSNTTEIRPRGFSFEPSMLSITIISLYLCYISVAIKKLRSFDFIVISFLLFLIHSKGGLLCFLIVFNDTFFSLKKRYMFFLLIVILSSFCFLIFMFVLDFDKHTSTITRGTLVLVPLFSLFEHPFGVGYFGFLDVFHQYLPRAVEFSKEYIHHNSGFREIDRYLISKTDSSIGSKSFFLNNVIIFGWPFIALYFYSLFSAVKKCRTISRKDLEVLVWFIFLSLTLFVEGVGLYALSLGFLVCRYEMYYANQKKSER